MRLVTELLPMELWCVILSYVTEYSDITAVRAVCSIFRTSIHQTTTNLITPQKITYIDGRLLRYYPNLTECTLVVMFNSEEHFSLTDKFTKLAVKCSSIHLAWRWFRRRLRNRHHNRDTLTHSCEVFGPSLWGIYVRCKDNCIRTWDNVDGEAITLLLQNELRFDNPNPYMLRCPSNYPSQTYYSYYLW